MKALFNSRRTVVLMLALALPALGLLAQDVHRPTATTRSTQQILIHMKEYISEIHETQMGLELADRLQRDGAHVTLWLELRAVRIADDRIVRNANPKPASRSFSDTFKSFVDHGGQVLVCRHCAAFEELPAEHVRAGARLIDVAEVAKAVLEADKILDY